MKIDEFLELTRNRRSIRRFKPDPFPDEYTDKILEAARWSMSGGNGQPWEFLVIKNQETKDKLADVFRRSREVSLAIEMTRMEEFRQPAFRGQSAETADKDIRARFTSWSGAPVIIVVLGDRRAMQASTLAGRMFELHIYDQNLAVCSYSIHLAAAALGLGAEWINVHPYAAEEMKPIMGVPPLLDIFTLNPIGYPAISPTPYRRDLKEMVHYEKFDMSRFRSNQDVVDFIRMQRQRHTTGGTYNVSGMKKPK